MIRRTGPISRLTPPKKRRSKPRRVGVERNPGYLAWLRHECKCVACLCVGRRRLDSEEAARTYANMPCDPMHGPPNGLGSKGPDSGAIPGCRYHHEEQTKIGWPAFEEKYGFSREKEASAHFSLYLIVRDSDCQR